MDADDAEYRPVEHDEQFQRVLDYAFRPTRGPNDIGALAGRTDRFVGDRRALCAGDDLLSVCIHIPFRTQLRGDLRDIVGLAAVATPPEYRRQGLVARLFAESLLEYRERGWPVVLLWPFDHGFYRQFGCATAARVAHITCPVDQLAVAQSEADGAFRPVGADDWATLDAVQAVADEGVHLAFDRTEEWWRRRVFRSWGTDPYAYIWERDGEPRGYLLYTLEEEQMRLEDYAAVDHEAYLNLLRFCHDHDSQLERVELYDHPRTDLLDIVADPGAVDCAVSAGPMGRLVDVPAALEALDYPADGTLAVAVEDSMADYNDGVFRIDVTDGTASVERTDESPAATVGVGTLFQLVAGYHSVAEAARLGSLDCRGRARETLAGFFPPRRVFVRDHF